MEVYTPLMKFVKLTISKTKPTGTFLRICSPLSLWIERHSDALIYLTIERQSCIKRLLFGCNFDIFAKKTDTMPCKIKLTKLLTITTYAHYSALQ